MSFASTIGFDPGAVSPQLLQAEADEDDDEENSQNQRLIPTILEGLESDEEEQQEAANAYTPDSEFNDVSIEFQTGVQSANFLEEIGEKSEKKPLAVHENPTFSQV